MVRLGRALVGHGRAWSGFGRAWSGMVGHRGRAWSGSLVGGGLYLDKVKSKSNKKCGNVSSKQLNESSGMLKTASVVVQTAIPIK